MDTVKIHIDGNCPTFSDPWIIGLYVGNLWNVRVLVWAASADDALEEAATWASENCPGALWEPEYKEACEEKNVSFDTFCSGALDEETNDIIRESAESDLMTMDCNRFLHSCSTITEITCPYAIVSAACSLYDAVDRAAEKENEIMETDAIDTETLSVCSGCSCGLANDDWTWLDGTYDADKSDEVFDAVHARMGELGHLHHVESVEDQENYGSDIIDCEICDQGIQGSYNLWAKR